MDPTSGAGAVGPVAETTICATVRFERVRRMSTLAAQAAAHQPAGVCLGSPTGASDTGQLTRTGELREQPVGGRHSKTDVRFFCEFEIGPPRREATPM